MKSPGDVAGTQHDPYAPTTPLDMLYTQAARFTEARALGLDGVEPLSAFLAMMSPYKDEAWKKAMEKVGDECKGDEYVWGVFELAIQTLQRKGKWFADSPENVKEGEEFLSALG